MVNKNEIIEFAKQTYDAILNDNYINLLPFLPGSIGSPVDWNVFLMHVKQAHYSLINDLEFFLLSDPAVDSKEEVIACYPGFKAIAYHRIAHIFYQMDMKVTARIISEEAHFLTGIDIHPGASIGSPFFIDHGTGIVIGETSIIGNYVKIYQGVTLGALSLAKGIELKGTKRHPTVLNNVTIYSGASILGDITIGNNCVIGSNVFLLEDIPDNHRVTLAKPELVVRKR